MVWRPIARGESLWGGTPTDEEEEGTPWLSTASRESGELQVDRPLPSVSQQKDMLANEPWQSGFLMWQERKRQGARIRRRRSLQVRTQEADLNASHNSATEAQSASIVCGGGRREIEPMTFKAGKLLGRGLTLTMASASATGGKDTCLPDPRGAVAHHPKLQLKSIEVNPHDVFFFNPLIMERFSCGRTLQSTIEDLVHGRVSADEIPSIRLVQRNDKLVTLDHRRLHAFQNALPPDSRIKAKLVPQDSLLNEVVSSTCKILRTAHIEKSRSVASRRLPDVLQRSSTVPALGGAAEAL